MGKGGQSLRPTPLRAHPNPPHRTRLPETPTGLRTGSERLPKKPSPAAAISGNLTAKAPVFGECRIFASFVVFFFSAFNQINPIQKGGFFDYHTSG